MGNGFTGPPAVDFYSMLSGLGDTIQANRAAQAKKDAISNATGPDGKVDYGKAMLGLANAGDTTGAALFAQAQNHQDALAHQAAEDTRAATAAATAEKHFQMSYGLQQSNAARTQANADREWNYDPTEERTEQAKANGLDPASPQGRSFVLTGKIPEASSGLSLNPIYGKDAEGNTVLLQAGKDGNAVQSKLPEGVTLNGVDNETLAADAKRLNDGDPNILKKYSNKGQGRVDLLRLNNEANRQRAEAGQSPVDITQNAITLQGDTARERASGTMEGRMAPASIEAQGAFKIAGNALDNLWRTNNVPLNRLLQMGEGAMSNPELKAAKVAVNTGVMTYSRAIAPTGVGTVDAQAHAREILDTADGPEATKAAFAQLAREVDMAHASPGLARQYFAAARKARLEGQPMPEMPQYQPAQPTATSAPPEAIAALKQDPRRAADFDAYYGAGSAKAVLGGGAR